MKTFIVSTALLGIMSFNYMQTCPEVFKKTFVKDGITYKTCQMVVTSA